MADAPGATPQTPEHVVGAAIQDLAAARLGRGFLPLAGVLVIGVAELLVGGPRAVEALALVVGAPLAGGAMLAHGMRIVQEAFGRAPRPWMAAASLGTLVPPAFGVYVFAWRGLREIAIGAGVGAVLLGVLSAALGLWALGTWMKLNELIRLARVMTWSGVDRMG